MSETRLMKAGSHSILVTIGLLFLTVFAGTINLSVQAMAPPLSLVVTPQLTMLGGYLGINATYTSNFDTQTTAYAIAVIRSNAGQTMGIFAGAFTIPPNASSSAFVVFYPPLTIPFNVYQIIGYVVNPQGGLISLSYTLESIL